MMRSPVWQIPDIRPFRIRKRAFCSEKRHEAGIGIAGCTRRHLSNPLPNLNIPEYFLQRPDRPGAAGRLRPLRLSAAWRQAPDDGITAIRPDDDPFRRPRRRKNGSDLQNQEIMRTFGGVFRRDAGVVELARLESE